MKKRKPRGRPFPKGNSLGQKFKPGQSGNPKGRPKSAGASMREWLNILGQCTEREIKQVAADPEAPWCQRAAAIQLLEALRPTGDVTDFAGLLDGSKTLTELRAQGVDTRAIKRLSIRPTRHGTACSIETRDSASALIWAIVDQTAGYPGTRVMTPPEPEIDPQERVHKLLKQVRGADSGEG